MEYLRKHIKIAASAVGCGVCVAGVLVAMQAPKPAPGFAVAAALAGSGTAPTVLVFVSGAVVHPGTYSLASDARVADAIAAAGGFTSGADLGRLPNLAARVHDGRQVNVPFAKSGGAAAASRLDINAASLDELASIPGMPAGLAQAIVDYRTQWGPFVSLSQLHTDLGVDSATVTAISKSLRVVIQ